MGRGAEVSKDWKTEYKVRKASKEESNGERKQKVGEEEMSTVGFPMKSVSGRWYLTLDFCIKEIKLTVGLPPGENPMQHYSRLFLMDSTIIQRSWYLRVTLLGGISHLCQPQWH